MDSLDLSKCNNLSEVNCDFFFIFVFCLGTTCEQMRGVGWQRWRYRWIEFFSGYNLVSVRLCQRDVFSLSTRSKIPYFFIFYLGHIWGFKEIIFSMLVNLSVLCSKKISCLDKIIVFLLLLYDFKLYISLFYILKPRNNGRRSKLCSLRLGFHPTNSS